MARSSVGGSHPYQRRLLKEYQGLVKDKLPGITLVQNSDNLTEFIFRIQVANHELYPEKDLYHLNIQITQDYPVDSPRVQFVHYETLDEAESQESKIPIHPHIYSNGHICLNLLGEDWTPACSIESILLSVQSMLDTNQIAERPEGDANYVKHAPRNPKQTKWEYHDDDV